MTLTFRGSSHATVMHDLPYLMSELPNFASDSLDPNSQLPNVSVDIF